MLLLCALFIACSWGPWLLAAALGVALDARKTQPKIDNEWCQTCPPCWGKPCAEPN